MPSVLARFRSELATRRDAGEPFDEAWPAALSSAVPCSTEGEDWRAVLRSTRSFWRSAYDRRPVRSCERPVLVLIAGDRVPLDPSDSGRLCDHCGQPIPAAKKASAIYCSEYCRGARNRRAGGAAVAA